MGACERIQRVLQEATARDMHRRHFAGDPRLPGMAWGFVEGSQNGLRLLMHRGDTDLFHRVLHEQLALDGGFPRLDAWLRRVEERPLA